MLDKNGMDGGSLFPSSGCSLKDRHFGVPFLERSELTQLVMVKFLLLETGDVRVTSQ